MTTFNDKPVYTLTQVAQSIQSMIERTYKFPYYVQAEMVKLNFYPRSGHCFPELVEKDGTRVKTQMRAVIWNSDYERISDNFQRITGEPLKDGITVLCLATIQFSPQYGLSLFIQNIEPSFTLGEMARNKLQTIKRLKEEGVFDANKKRKMPLLPQRIAVISIETSKGYNDFKVTLQGDKNHYPFETELFPSLLQGEKAVVTMLEQLDRIEKRLNDFDCVAIIRGGGGDVGLTCYDQYELAHRVATFPLPILSGIGHSTNETVTESVSFANKITPTEVAYYLISKFSDFEAKVTDLQLTLAKTVRHMLERENACLARTEADFKLAAHKVISYENTQLMKLQQLLQLSGKQLIEVQKRNLDNFAASLRPSVTARLTAEKAALDNFNSTIYIYTKQKLSSAATDISHIEEKIQLLNPANILKRGFSITYHNGSPVLNADSLHPDDELETHFYHGTRQSVVRE